MKTSFLFLLAIGLFILSSTFAGPVIELKSEYALKKNIKQRDFSGVILVAQDSKILMKQAFGYKNLKTKIPITTNDRFQIGSNTKQFVAASLLLLQEDGRLSLNDSVTKYLPSLTEYSEVRIVDLLNHSSGITNFTDHEEFWGMVNYDVTMTLDDIINFSRNYPLDFAPRAKWSYSNTGYILAGKIMEQVSDESWDNFIKNHFLRPLEMNDSGYQIYFEQASDVLGHIRNEGRMESVPKFNLSWALSAGALYSTADDLLKWTSIYDNSTLVSEESKKMMQTPFLENYGLGVRILPLGNDVVIEHGGRTPGFVSKIMYLKNAKLAIIVLDNIDGAVQTVPDLLFEFFTSGHAQAIRPANYSMPVETYQDFVGNYVGPRLSVKIFVTNGQLFLQPNDGQPPYLLRANDKDSFNLEEFAGEEFIRNTEGEVVELKHYQHGQVSYFEKK
ncbi:MAG: hypothetical protein A2504_12120 [Bdellovibrionales bacterium RIFOXYD12_FULL_39_22]|nr:MAG: hypothetical protein A2385_00225 [Bdellovibrionales bacterium RIFOXYB1_FULL_39_21]OFZ43074.1 MAG: hypothetical protein A2485_03890 [Bdellovibrionales bacterium RIFOXYC12_FULL_39_17]OFZ46890.1 MAG: hypothetical protein A2404_02170 [Bdellovibrionales bacterium RIFOXYC1_FULL_39_130]OFZ75275.1 MAG: hypothetical protein A2560_14915 [Bdellovibrionales bacterium RIFOXYD1_FULL_39_84]OFZ94955.1 MAG: hypothetical protein A2504_12120 [Bdellovibrionales bacterium RIFOXYD12_FULL_39_22]HLE09606.1 se